VAKTGRRFKRIIGGEESKAHQWPWQAEIVLRNTTSKRYEHRCGGTLIGRELVVTAASCMFNKDKYFFRVKLGEHIRDKYDYYHETDHWISVIHLHSRFLADQEYAYDIALLKIYPPASISSAVYPISLPKLFEQVPVGTKCTMS
ncbi:hypothetical protein QZH41_013137, partial [Actinostola sp. cb2023]